MRYRLGLSILLLAFLSACDLSGPEESTPEPVELQAEATGESPRMQIYRIGDGESYKYKEAWAGREVEVGRDLEATFTLRPDSSVVVWAGNFLDTPARVEVTRVETGDVEAKADIPASNGERWEFVWIVASLESDGIKTRVHRQTGR